MAKKRQNGRPRVSLEAFEVPCDDLCWTCTAQEFTFECTDELHPLEGFIGQERALRAIEFSLDLDKAGYNLFVTGLTGTGKASAIKSYVEKVVAERSSRSDRLAVHDWCYVYNFSDPDRPQALQLAPGQGRTLRRQMEALLLAVREEVPRAFGSDAYSEQRREVEEQGRSKYQDSVRDLEKEVSEEGFAVQFTPSGVNLFPVSDGKPIQANEYMALSEEVRSEIDEKRERLLSHVQDTLEALRSVERETRDRIAELDREVGNSQLTSTFRDVQDDFREVPQVGDFLAAVKQYTLANLHLFRETQGQAANVSVPGPYPAPMAERNPLLPYEVNVVVDNGGVQGAPIIVESNPNWGNLFGRIERRALMGTYFSDHTMLKAGALHQANGGYLVLNVRDLLTNPGVWVGLKRVIRNREIRLEDPVEQSGFFVPLGLRPQPIPVDVKVIVTGDEDTYRLLSSYDQEDFWEMFKVKAEFDYQIDLTQENVTAYAAFICGTCEGEGLRHFDPQGVARVVEYGARLVADQQKLSTRFGQIKDLVVEADYWARREGAELVGERHVKRALDEKVYRLNLVEERIRRLISEGTLMVNLEDEVVGQINGLVVYDLGDFSFGRPSRITVRTFAGRRGVINIERESQLSGRIHDKGVLILSGYLGWKYAQNTPLALSASISFEQSYEGVEGDSASSTELYGILSSLAGLPVKQGIAVTGSVNQMGEIQPIGGANQKVEGFFDICRVKGLNGRQGVIIPHQNVKNLMLRQDVVEAVRQGRFHVYTVKTVDQGIEILTGVPAGQQQPDGSYPGGTVNFLVDRRLKEMAESLRGFYAEQLGSPV